MEFTDQIGRKITLAEYPRRIVSLVPSQTELLVDLGLREQLVGVTRFCVHPVGINKEKKRVGGTKDFKVDVIRELRPDLIIGNKEENEPVRIGELEKKFPVWISDVQDLALALEMINGVGELTGKKENARSLVREIKTRFSALEQDTSQRPAQRVAYFIWRRPYMVVGGDTFIHDMLQRAGFENVFGRKNRYPKVSEEELGEARPEILLLSSEPFPFREKHLQEFRNICPEAEVQIVDGQLFSWYGSRLLECPGYFKRLYSQIGPYRPN